MGIVSIQNVSFRYQSAYSGDGISKVSMEIQPGDCMLICGKSGSGKTTISKLINGLIPHFESGKKVGHVFLNDKDIDEIPMYQIALKVASVFQDPKSQFFNIDTESEIIFSLENRGETLELVEERLDRTVEELHISRLLGKNLFEMSSGEKQIIAFACAYASDPDVLVLDEPSSNLDLEAIEIIKNIIIKMKNQGKTIIITEHRFSYLYGVIDYAVYLNHGKIKNYYTAHQFFALSEKERKQLGLRQLIPYTQVTVKSDHIHKRILTHSLELNNIEIILDRKPILQNISFSLHSGDIAAIVGVNGVGKTTLCRSICGFIDHTRGDILFDGKILKKKQRLKKSYIVMQDINCQLFADNVLGECLLGNPLVTEEQVLEILEQLELTDYRDVHPQCLSGGQKQRLVIAGAILAGKDILILDEPTSGLDYESMMKVSKLLKDLSDQGKIILIITHDMEFIEAACNRCIHLTSQGVNKSDTIILTELFPLTLSDGEEYSCN